MALVRWDPLATRGVEIDRLNRMFSDLHTEGTARVGAGGRHLRDRGHEVVIKAELPDVRKEDISVTFENGVLTSGRAQAGRVGRAGAGSSDSSGVTARSTRSFTLPDTVDACRDRRRLQGRRADDPAAAARGEQAEADLGQTSSKTAPAVMRRPGGCPATRRERSIASPSSYGASARGRVTPPPISDSSLAMARTLTPNPSTMRSAGENQALHHEPVPLRRRRRATRQAAAPRRRWPRLDRHARIG